MQRQDAIFQFCQNIFLPLRLGTVDIGMACMFRVQGIMDKAHVVHARQQCRAIGFAVGRNAAHTHAAKTHPVVAALASDKHIAVAFPTGAVVGQREFERCVCRFRA